MCKLKHLAVATAIIGLATHVQAGYFAGSTDFEGANPLADGLWSNAVDAAIEVDASIGSVSRALNLPPSFDANSRTNVLSVDSDDPVVRYLQEDRTAPAASAIYADFLIKTYPLANGLPAPEVGPDDKILVYTRVNAAGTATNLCVLARPDANSQTNEFVLTKSIGKDEWHRIVIKAENGAYQVFCDDLNTPCTDGTVSTYYPINAVAQGAASMSNVAFAGSAYLDDLILSTFIPDLPIATLTWDTNSFSSVSYVVGNATNALNAADGSFELQVQNGTSVTLVGNTGYYDVTATGTATTGSVLALNVTAPTGLAKFAPGATGTGTGAANDPYTIPDYPTLVAMQVALENDAANFADKHYVQTADINMSSVGAFSITSVFSGVYDGQNHTISGVQLIPAKQTGFFQKLANATVSNLTVTATFASSAGSIGGAIFAGDVTGTCRFEHIITEGSFSGTHNCSGMVGNDKAKSATTDLTFVGCTNRADVTTTYTKAAGLMNYTEATGATVTFIDCANEGDITCAGGANAGGAWAGGFMAYIGKDNTTHSLIRCVNTGAISATQDIATTQNSSFRVGGLLGNLNVATVSLTDCSNTGAISGAARAVGSSPVDSAVGGLVGYGTAILAGNCSNSGTVGYTLPAGDYTFASKGSLVGNGNPTVNAGATITAPATEKPIGKGSCAALNFATVDNNVATFVSALAAGNTYKVMLPDATATYNFTAFGSISFDTNLVQAVTFNITSTGAAGYPVASTSGTVVTYSTGYFPRTATAGQDGSASNPYEIADLDDLEALQAAVANAPATFAGLSYVQTDDIALTNAWEGIGIKGGKDLAANDAGADKNAQYDAGAFRGVYDGGNHTISNFQMENGTDYGALFNSIYGATIKNLKMSWGTTTLCANSSANGGDTGATFVGVAKESTLSNLTALAGANVVVSASKDFGGIVGYLMAGSTVDSCTNELNVASLKGNRKCGGIAIITQSGSGTATIRNCKNSGTSSGGAQNGAIVGYIGTTTAIIGCENTANAPLLTCQEGTVTVSGYTKSVAHRTPFVKKGGTVNGLNFATVDDDVATFVADNALAAGNTYEVMATNATARYNFTAPGTIAFDQRLFTPTYDITAANGLTVMSATSGNVTTYTASIAAATWIGGAQGDWDVPANWDGGFVPTNATVVTFTNDAQVAIDHADRCKELVLDNANVTLVRASGVEQPILRFYNNEGRAVSVASGATGSLAVNNLALFTESPDRNNNLTIDCALAVLGDVTFRGINIIPNQLAASFTITGKTTVSANATVKTIDWGNTIFQGGIEVAKGVTAKIQTDPNGYAQIGAAVTLVANDGEGDSTTIWLMRSSNRSGKVSLFPRASVSVDADHAATYYIKTSSAEVTDEHGLNPITCDVYTATRNPTVSVTANGVTVAGVENGQKIMPGTNLVISVSGIAAGYEPSVTITKTADSSVLLTTNAVSFTYTMPDFDIGIDASAVKTAPSYYDPEGTLIEDYAVISWLSGNGFTQAQIDALGNNAAGTDRLYYCYLLNLNFTVQDASAALSFTEITVSNRVSMTVQLVRKAPLAGYINGALYIYGANNLAAGFGRTPIPDESVEYFTGDPTFNLVTGTDDTVTQTAVATLNSSVTAKFFKATIEVPWVDNGDEPYWEPEPEPEPEPEGQE